MYGQTKSLIKTVLLVMLTLIICAIHLLSAVGALLVREYTYSEVDYFAVLFSVGLALLSLALTILHRHSLYYSRLVSDNILRIYSLVMIVKIAIRWRVLSDILLDIYGIVILFVWAVVPIILIVISFIDPYRKCKKLKSDADI